MKPGDRCTWRFVPRGGYGFAISVDVTIVSVGRKRIQVRAPLEKGGSKLVWVRRDALKVEAAGG